MRRGQQAAGVGSSGGAAAAAAAAAAATPHAEPASQDLVPLPPANPEALVVNPADIAIDSQPPSQADISLPGVSQDDMHGMTLPPSLQFGSQGLDAGPASQLLLGSQPYPGGGGSQGYAAMLGLGSLDQLSNVAAFISSQDGNADMLGAADDAAPAAGGGAAAAIKQEGAGGSRLMHASGADADAAADAPSSAVATLLGLQAQQQMALPGLGPDQLTMLMVNGGDGSGGLPHGALPVALPGAGMHHLAGMPAQQLGMTTFFDAAGNPVYLPPGMALGYEVPPAKPRKIHHSVHKVGGGGGGGGGGRGVGRWGRGRGGGWGRGGAGQRARGRK